MYNQSVIVKAINHSAQIRNGRPYQQRFTLIQLSQGKFTSGGGHADLQKSWLSDLIYG
jgi:ABC-type tungstate transport system permease subunit